MIYYVIDYISLRTDIMHFIIQIYVYSWPTAIRRVRCYAETDILELLL